MGGWERKGKMGGGEQKSVQNKYHRKNNFATLLWPCSHTYCGS